MKYKQFNGAKVYETQGETRVILHHNKVSFTYQTHDSADSVRETLAKVGSDCKGKTKRERAEIRLNAIRSAHRHVNTPVTN